MNDIEAARARVRREMAQRALDSATVARECVPYEMAIAYESATVFVNALRTEIYLLDSALEGRHEAAG